VGDRERADEAALRTHVDERIRQERRAEGLSRHFGAPFDY
jgi:ribosome-binding protein aMBF1 (putative translation factor)